MDVMERQSTKPQVIIWGYHLGKEREWRIFTGGTSFSGTVGRFFPRYGEHKPNFKLLYDRMCEIDITGQFGDDGTTLKLVALVRSQGKKVVAITDSPENLSRRILADIGIDPDCDFDLYLPYTIDRGPLKILEAGRIFEKVASCFEMSLTRTISIGNSYRSDIKPARRLGMKTCLVSFETRDGDVGLQVKSFGEVFLAYRNSL